MSRTDYEKRLEKAVRTGKWAVTMAKVRIRQIGAHKPWPRWHFVDFHGPAKRESRGIVDMIAIRKDHNHVPRGLKRGDALQIIPVQVKGGSAARPTPDDAKRLRIVARHHGACAILLATWKKGKPARFYSLNPKVRRETTEWAEVTELEKIFC